MGLGVISILTGVLGFMGAHVNNDTQFYHNRLEQKTQLMLELCTLKNDCEPLHNYLNTDDDGKPLVLPVKVIQVQVPAAEVPKPVEKPADKPITNPLPKDFYQPL